MKNLAYGSWLAARGLWLVDCGLWLGTRNKLIKEIELINKENRGRFSLVGFGAFVFWWQKKEIVD
jgi:hypothetical protein